MRNQIQVAERLGIRADTLNSSNREEWDVCKRRLRANQTDLLLVSPERLSDDDFRSEVLLPLAGSFGLFIIDEAHCISDWGHDFRPDYLRITQVLKALPPNAPALTTTATANNRVVEDFVLQLGSRLWVIRGRLMR